MPIPKVMGFPLYRGRIKKRLLKKLMVHMDWSTLDRCTIGLANIKIGDFVSDCSGFNGKILDMAPNYWRFTKHYQRLIDVDIYTTNSSCSVCNCAIGLPKTQLEIETYVLGFIKKWIFGESGKRWYGETTEEYKACIERATKTVAIIESGGHITDNNGCPLPGFERIL
jgi:hypothetical protein